jgi:hypothetical protein
VSTGVAFLRTFAAWQEIFWPPLAPLGDAVGLGGLPPCLSPSFPFSQTIPLTAVFCLDVPAGAPSDDAAGAGAAGGDGGVDLSGGGVDEEPLVSSPGDYLFLHP